MAESEFHYQTIQAFLEDLTDHNIEIEHNMKITKKAGVWKTFNEMKQAIEDTYNIDYHHTSIFFEDDDGIKRKINNEKDYFEAVKTVDAIRFHLIAEFDDKKVKKEAAPVIDLNAPIKINPWACTRCQARNGPENLRCKVCSLQRKN